MEQLNVFRNEREKRGYFNLIVDNPKARIESRFFGKIYDDVDKLFLSAIMNNLENCFISVHPEDLQDFLEYIEAVLE